MFGVEGSGSRPRGARGWSRRPQGGFEPLLLPAVGVGAGAWIGTQAAGFPEVPSLGWSAATVAAMGALVLRRRRPAAALVALAVALGGVAASLGARAFLAPERQHLVALWEGLGEGREEPLRLMGTVARDPEIAPDVTRLLVDVTAIAVGGDLQTTRGRVRLTVRGRLEALAYGDVVEAWARLRRPDEQRNPGGYDARAHLRGRGVALTGTVKSARLVEVVGRRPGSRILAACETLRRRIAWRLSRAFPPERADDRALASAFLLGARGELSEEDEDALLAGGTYHVLAISGLHVVLLGGLVAGGLALLGWPGFRGRAAIVGAAIAVYAGVTEVPASVGRAAIMGGLVVAFRIAGERGGALHAIALSFVVLVLVSPLQVLDPGFQLTYAATVGIVLLGGTAGPFSALHRFLGRHVGAALAVGLAAWVATLPLVHERFYRLAPGALALNLLAVPLSTVALAAALVGCAVPGAAGDALLGVGAALIRLIVRASAWLGTVPALSYPACAPPPGLAAVTLAVAAVCALLHAPAVFLGRRPRGPWVGSVGRHGSLLLLLACVVAHLATGAKQSAVETFRLTVLDVGQGDAILLQSPGGAAALIDGGGAAGTGFDVGRRVVVPSLLSLGVRRLEAVILTHAHPDHGDGLVSVVRTLRVRELVEGGPLLHRRSDGFYGRLREAAATAGIPRRSVQRGDVLHVGRLTLEVEGPASADPRRSARNDDSVVVTVTHGAHRFLLPGDIEASGEAGLLPGVAPCDVLKVAHHGSSTSTGPEFVARAVPRIALISVGRWNAWGFPRPEVLARLRGSRVLSTAADGALMLSSDGSHLEVTCMREVRLRSVPGRWPPRPGGGPGEPRIAAAGAAYASEGI